MTRAQAQGLLQRWLKRRGLESAGLNEKGFGGVSIAEVDLYFEHREDAGTLKCMALVYRFRGQPKPQVVESFRQLEKAKALETGGGKVDFQPESRGIYLSRSYADPVADAQLDEDLQRLGEASITWRDRGVKKVADQLSGF